ncbi:hypothetical protein ABH313_24165 [Chromobacterium vaccinii]|uniref:hypothetical protein n=1 Tax=Chromobacterium vaccinii TaxID=1108595 RepID=UPI0032601A64
MKQKVVVLVAQILAGLVVWLSVRSFIGAAIASVLAGVSAQVMAAGSGKAAAGAWLINWSALGGAVAGSLMLALQLRDRPWGERLMLVGASLLAAYYGGLFAGELFAWDRGGVGVAGAVSAYLFVPVMDTALRLIRDISWIKSLLERRA